VADKHLKAELTITINILRITILERSGKPIVRIARTAV